MRTEAIRQRRPRHAGVVAASALVAGLTAAPLAGANVYKCQDDAGGVVYQEAPCPPGRELRNFDADPPDLSVIHGGLTRAPVAVETPRDARTIRGDATPGKAAGDAKARKFIHSGMTEAEVLVKVGRPDATSGGSKARQTRWSYLPADGDPDTVTSITFAGGIVSDVTRKVVKR
jgi:hypothetical protein